MIEDVLELMDRGLTPVPLFHASKKPMLAWGKLLTAVPPRKLVELWFRRITGPFNIAIMTGRLYGGLVVVDFDNKPDYYRWLRATGGIDTMTVATARGYHVYLWADDCPEKTGAALFDGALVGDLKASGLVTAPPSAHPNGYTIYSYLNRGPIARSSLQALGVSAYYTPRKSVEWTGDQEAEKAAVGIGLVSEIKAAYPITWMLREYTNLIIPSGPDFLLARCPFHDDGRPSMWVNIRRNKCGCFSPSCPAHRSMDVIDLFALYHHIDNRRAILGLASELGLI